MLNSNIYVNFVKPYEYTRMYIIYLYEYTSIYLYTFFASKLTCIKLLFKLINDYFNNLTIINRNNFVINSNINF